MASPEDLDLLSTRSLIAEARSGNERAAELLGRRYLTSLQRWARSRVPDDGHDEDRAALDDLVQDGVQAALKEARARDGLRGGGFLSHLRKCVLAQVGKAASDRRGAPVEGSPIGRRIGPRTLERYERALARLAPVDHELVVARVELQLDYPQIAQLLGEASPDAARTTVSRALVRLAGEMAAAVE